MNARSVVGRKDVFLSYAHININFARRLKVRVHSPLNSEPYHLNLHVECFEQCQLLSVD